MSSQERHTVEERRRYALEAMRSGPEAVADKAGVKKETVQEWMREAGASSKTPIAQEPDAIAAAAATAQAVHSGAGPDEYDDPDEDYEDPDEDEYDDSILDDHSDMTAGFAWENWEDMLKDKPEMVTAWDKCVQMWGVVKLNGVQDDYDSHSRQEYGLLVRELAEDIYEQAYIDPPDTPSGFEPSEWDQWVTADATQKVEEMIHTAVLDDPAVGALALR